MAQNTKVVTTPVVASYPHLFEAYASIEGSKPKRSVTILIPKTDTELVEKINAAVEAAITEGVSKKFNGKTPNKASLHLPLKDGDEKDASEFKGHYYIQCTSANEFEIVDINLNPITDKNAIVGGDKIRISLNFAAYSVGPSKGVSAYINSVQLFEKTDHPFGGKGSAQTDFASANNKEFM